MRLLFNDKSLQGQFASADDFANSIGLIFKMQSKVGGSHKIGCTTAVLDALVTSRGHLRRVVRDLKRDQQQALFAWLTKAGPFWNENAAHSDDEYFDCDGDVVTRSAIAEAAVLCALEQDVRLVSLVPSSWTFTPLTVTEVTANGTHPIADVPNYWTEVDLASAVKTARASATNWHMFEATCRTDYPLVSFGESAFASLLPTPFSRGASNRLSALLDVLNRYAACVGSTGARSPEGQRLYSEYFEGKRAWFTDSSDTEKQQMGDRLVFPHPTEDGTYLDCSWHGKVSTQVLRLHFGWPRLIDGSVHVAYVGPKLTKR